MSEIKVEKPTKGKNQIPSMIVSVGEDLISLGSVEETLIHPRRVVTPAIKANANSVCIVHNHPIGGSDPSEEDLNMKSALMNVSEILKMA